MGQLPKVRGLYVHQRDRPLVQELCLGMRKQAGPGLPQRRCCG